MSDLFFKNVLVVDDEPSYRTLVQQFLSRFGYRCEAAQDADAALEILNSQVFELVVSDIRMPGADGLELMKTVRSRNPAVSFIIMTGHAADYSYSELIEAGAADYLTKPFEIGELQAKIQRLERERRITKLLEASNQALAWESRLNAAMAEISKALISSEPVERMSELIMKNARELTSSACGCVMYMDPETGKMSLSAVSEGPSTGDMNFSAPLHCARCQSLEECFLHEIRPMVRNSPPATAGHHPSTPGDVPVERFLAVPVVLGVELMGGIALANADRDYGDSDLRLIGRMAEVYALAIRRKRFEESLTRAKAYIEKVFDNSADAIGIIDKHGRAIKWNQAASVIFGYSLEELQTRKVFELYADKQQLELMLTLLRHEGFVRRYEIDCRKKDGTVVPMEISISLLRTDDGEIQGSVGVVRDLSDTKQRLLEAETINERLEQEISERRRVAEELRTSQQIIEGILNAIPVRVFWKDTNLAYLGCNTIFAHDAGFDDPKDIIGKDDFQMVWREQAELYRNDDRQVIESGLSKLLVEEPQRTPQGDIITLLTSKIPLRNSTGEISGVLGMYLDITERRRAEEGLRQAHAELAQLVASIPSILIGLSGEDHVIWWNDAAEETFALRRVEVLGRPLGECGLQWEWERVLGGITQCRHNQSRIRLEDIRFVRPDDKEGFLGINISPLGDSRRDHPGTIILARDITDRKLMESQLAQAQKLESIGQLAAGIAHEINTPTQYVGDNTRFLQDAFQDLSRLLERYAEVPEALKAGASAEELRAMMQAAAEEADLEYLAEEIPKAVQQSLEGVERVSKIVRAMKEFSHPGTEEKTAIDINNAIESTITVARNEWKYVADLVTDLDRNLPLVPCLPGEFNQVILNLIINAAHAIADVVGRDSGERGTITVSTRYLGDATEIRLADSGGGIPEAIRARIFDPFFTTKEVGKGTGQGLAIARSVIVDKHGGTITFETELGKGTTFVIRLPIAGNPT
jgi:PAS domain S-box-containing protein